MRLFKKVRRASIMSGSLLMFLVGSGIFFTACSQPKYISSEWNSDEHKQVENIPVTSYQYDREDKLFYRITNDSNNLYIYLNAFEETTQTKILMFGFTVWIDTTARNKKQMGIKYPLVRNERKQSMETKINSSGDFKRTNQENRTSLINQLNEIELIAFEGKKSTSHLYAGNENDIRGNIELGENSALLYKLTIPMERIGINPLKEGTILSINMESGNMEMMKPSGSGGKQGAGGMGGGRPGGATGRMGGGMGRNPQAMQGGTAELFQPVNIKLKIKLSVQDDIR
ncbi:hypothetical protein [uncultured Draconibacterium sp.]|uniref:hypothetical protein n=1 Tax=uncultured Draconibacterium sp. TaxID=1573823 RepID=UPI003217B90A